MSRYYSDSEDGLRGQSNSIRASGWQSPLPPTNAIPFPSSSSPSVTRLVVECPFGLKKCDYTIDKSQRGLLIVTARRRSTFASEYLSSSNPNNKAVQTFVIPSDADVSRLQSHVDRSTNSLIIEVPRLRSFYQNTNDIYANSNRKADLSTQVYGASRLVPDERKYAANNNRNTLEYRIDCRGYTADELDVFIQGQDLIVRSKVNSTQRNRSRAFSRKISLPNTVDTRRVVSYFKDGELRVTAPLKRGNYSNSRQTFSAGIPTAVVSSRAAVRSPTPSNQRSHYRRHERVSHRHAYNQRDKRRPSTEMRRARSTEALSYPLYRSPRYFDDEEYDEDNEDEDNERAGGRRRRTDRVRYEGYSINSNKIEAQPVYGSAYIPTDNVGNTRKSYRNYPTDRDVYVKY